MFTAFARFADGTAEQIASLDVLGPTWARDGVTVWVDLQAPTPEELAQLASIADVDAALLEAFQKGRMRPHIEEFEDYLFLVLQGALPPKEGEEFQPRQLAAFCGPRFLVTLHQEPLRSITTLRDKCGRLGAQLLGRGTDYLLFDIIDMMVDRYVETAEHFERLVEHLEEESLDDRIDSGIVQMVSRLHRELLELRRSAAAKRDLVAPVARGEYDHISTTLGQRFARLRDHLNQLVDQISGLRERLDGVRDNYHSTLATRTNEAMRKLTAYAAILLPLSAIAGVYGMNLGIWPNDGHWWGFWAVLGIMALVGSSMFVYFKRHDWL